MSEAINSNNNTSLLRLLVELRKRLLCCLLVVLIIFSVLFYFANNIYTLLALPLLHHLPKGQGLIAINIMAPFFVPFELTFVAAIFLAVPFFLYQLWAFVAPALYQHERRLIWPLLLMSTLLFYSGVAFAYWIIFPLIFLFLTNTAPLGVLVNPDISQYLDLCLKLFFIFGVMFEIPIATLLLVWTKILTYHDLIKIRPYIIIAAFVLGMILGPPDVLSQIVLAVPLWLLYELGILVSRFFAKEKK